MNEIYVESSWRARDEALQKWITKNNKPPKQTKRETEKVELKCFMGVKAIRSRAGRMKEQKWRASRGERQGRSQGRETESVARSR